MKKITRSLNQTLFAIWSCPEFSPAFWLLFLECCKLNGFIPSCYNRTPCLSTGNFPFWFNLTLVQLVLTYYYVRISPFRPYLLLSRLRRPTAAMNGRRHPVPRPGRQPVSSPLPWPRHPAQPEHLAAAAAVVAAAGQRKAR